jgi:hypothetical protein
MSDSQTDSGRALVVATLATGLLGLGLFLVILLTVMQYGQLNQAGQAIVWAAVLLTAVAMALGLYLALTARSRALASPGLSGAGWFLVSAGLVLVFPALGASVGFAAAPGVSTFSTTAGAMFLIIGGAGLLQAERAARHASRAS